MKVTIRKPAIDINGNAELRNISPVEILIDEEAVMGIDGSTKNTGIAIARKKDGALLYSCSIAREGDESPVQFKVRLKRLVDSIIQMNRRLDTIYYEEPFIGYASAVPNLMMLRTFVEEIIVEHEPDYSYIKHAEINNKRWKKLFLMPDKCPSSTELEKKAVRDKLVGFLPCMSIVTQDEIDAYAMTFVAAMQISNGTAENLESKKVHAFNYEMKFIGANDDDDMLLEFSDAYTGPKYLLENGISFTTIGGRVNFDKYVYTTMGVEDKVLILKFESRHHGDLILKNRIGVLASQYDYLYAIIWRKSRK